MEAVAENNRIRQQWIINAAVFVAALLLLGGPVLYAYSTARQDAERLVTGPRNPILTGNEALVVISAAVQQAEYLPRDETPDVVLVTDPSSFPSLQTARPGDIILLYRRANLAALFDSVTKGVITAVPIIPQG